MFSAIQRYFENHQSAIDLFVSLKKVINDNKGVMLMCPCQQKQSFGSRFDTPFPSMLHGFKHKIFYFYF